MKRPAHPFAAPLLPSSSTPTSSVDGVIEPSHNSLSSTTISIVKCFVGAASFELPGAIQNGGLAGSVIGVLSLAIISYYTLRMLARCGELLNSRATTYPEIGHAALGSLGWTLAWTGIMFMTIGVCGAYFVFVANMASDLLAYDRSECIAVLLPSFILLSWGPYKYLTHFSAIGISALVFALVVVMCDAFKYNTVAPATDYPAFNPDTYSLFLGNTAFVYLIHSVVLPMRNQMEAPRFCPKTLLYAVVIVTVLNMGFAIPVYLLYNAETQGNIIDNLHPGNLKKAVQIALCVDLFFTYALFLFPMSEALENDLTRAWERRREKGGEEKERDWELPWQFRAFLRALLVATTALLAYLVPDFSSLSALSGGFGNNLVGFILPPLFITVIKVKQNWWRENGVGRGWQVIEVGANVCIGMGGVGLLVSSVQSFVGNL